MRERGPTSKHNLEYEPSEMSARTWRMVRRVSIAIFALALISVAIAGIRRVTQQASYLSKQRTLMNYQVSDGLIEVTATGQLRRATKWPSAASIVDVDSFAVQTAPVFIHARRSRGGVERLIVVHESVVAGGLPGLKALVAKSYVPASLKPGSRLRPIGEHTLQHPAMVIHAGVADTQDASHFTITYELDGQPGTIDGWLVDDRSVVLEVRDGPLKNPGLPPPASTSETRIPASRPS